MDHDVLRRQSIERDVSAQIQSTLTPSLALKVAAKFSDGAKCCEGAGPHGPTFRGTFNISYWIEVDGHEEWVVRFPLLGMFPISTTVAKLNSKIATLKFLSEKTSVRVPRLIGFGLGDD